MNGFLEGGYGMGGIEGQIGGSIESGGEGITGGGVGGNEGLGASGNGGYHNIVSTSGAFEWGLHFS